MPSVMRDHASITDAQRSRGLRINSGGVKTRINSQLSILAPTVMTSLERGFSLAESMAARGYSKSRTRYNPEKWTLKEKTQTCVFLAALVLTLCSKYAGQLEYWPYSSLVSQPLSYPPMLALFSILTPLTDHE
jgi:energy-coupling factor transporter transmembrane protein EcfT